MARHGQVRFPRVEVVVEVVAVAVAVVMVPTGER